MPPDAACAKGAPVIRFSDNLAPNPMKVAPCLEATGLPHDAVAVDTRKAEQHAAAFPALNPNGKLPVIVDGDAVVFGSNAILLRLAETTGRFLPAGAAAERGALLSWLMFVASGAGPVSGRANHFGHCVPGPVRHARTRDDHKARRHRAVVDARPAAARALGRRDRPAFKAETDETAQRSLCAHAFVAPA